MATFLTEADVERSLLEQLSEMGYETAQGPEIAPGGERSERRSWEDVVLRDRLRAALVRINAHLPAGAVEEALRKAGRLESPSLIQNNRRFHQRLVERVDVEVQRPARAGGGIQDTDLGGHLTLKRYHSEKAQSPDGTWQHTRITLMGGNVSPFESGMLLSLVVGGGDHVPSR
jgi:hypothetical protein